MTLTGVGAVPVQASGPPMVRRIDLMPQRFTAPGAAAPGVISRDAYATSWYTELQWPLPPGTAVSSEYGHRSCEGCSAFHEGIDFDPGNGTQVAAIADGIVVEAVESAEGLGVHVVIEHRVDGAPMRSTYAHLQHGSVPVAAGDAVVRGTVIGLVGDTGQSTGPHLHFSIDLGAGYVDPMPWMLAHVNS